MDSLLFGSKNGVIRIRNQGTIFLFIYGMNLQIIFLMIYKRRRCLLIVLK